FGPGRHRGRDYNVRADTREGARAVPQEQEQRRIQRRSGGEGAAEGEAGQVGATAKGEKLKEERDEILDEIDSVLEANDEEFVQSHVQQGGQWRARASCRRSRRAGRSAPTR